MSRVIVTGGLGFLGSHLVDLLLKEGDEVTIVDNMSTNVVGPEYFAGRARVLTSSVQDTKFSELGKSDFPYHLACVVGPSGILKYAGQMGLDILLDTKLLMDYSSKHGAKLIDISTSEVYGQPGFLTEDTEKHTPANIAVRTEYGAGKMLGEILTINRAKVDPNLHYHIIRPFNITGPRQKPDCGFVLPRFVVAALTDQPITVFGDGSQERAFTHVRDMAEGIISIAHSPYDNEVWNVGNPDNRTTIYKLASVVAEETKAMFPKKNPTLEFIDGKTVHGPLFEEVPDKLPVIGKIRSKIGWEPKIPLQQVVRETLEFYAPLVEQGLYFKVK